MSRAKRKDRLPDEQETASMETTTDVIGTQDKNRKTSYVHEGFFKVGEEAMRLIARSGDSAWDARNAKTTYVTLCRVANLKRGDTFDVPISSLANDMHFVYRDAQKELALVESIGLVRIERRKIEGNLRKCSIHLYRHKDWC